MPSKGSPSPAQRLEAWAEKVCTWAEAQAAINRTKAKTCDFESLRQAYIFDAKNYERMASEGRAALEEGGGRGR